MVWKWQLTTGIRNWLTTSGDRGSPEPGTIIACSQEQIQRVKASFWSGLTTSRHHKASWSMTVISDVKKALEATFNMENRGRIHWFLGLRIQREEGKVTVDQERYIKTMLVWFQTDQCKPSRTPVVLNLKLQTTQNGDEEVDQRIYRSLVGSLLHLAKQERPEIMFTVNILSRHINTPSNQHWMCGKKTSLVSSRFKN